MLHDFVSTFSRRSKPLHRQGSRWEVDVVDAVDVLTSPMVTVRSKVGPQQGMSGDGEIQNTEVDDVIVGAFVFGEMVEKTQQAFRSVIFFHVLAVFFGLEMVQDG